MKLGLTFDDVALVPRFNNVDSRTEPSLWTKLTKNRNIQAPILAANMESVLSEELIKILEKNGIISIFPRFMDEKILHEWIKKFPKGYVSVGVKDKKKMIELFGEHGVTHFCIDVAHGHSSNMLKLIENVKRRSEVDIIAGNVCTPRAVHDLYNAGADAIKVGIGPGAACTTRSVTGFGVPQFSSIKLCAEEARLYDIPIIADGGIRSSRDIVLALAAGASSVMIGKLFALTEESGAEKRNIMERVRVKAYRPGDPMWRTRVNGEAKYRGQASSDFQEEILGGVKEGTVPEGESGWAPVSGSAQQLIDQLLGGIRSGLTYGGARDIPELQRKAEFIRVTPAYAQEMAVRI